MKTAVCTGKVCQTMGGIEEKKEMKKKKMNRKNIKRKKKKKKQNMLRDGACGISVVE